MLISSGSSWACMTHVPFSSCVTSSRIKTSGNTACTCLVQVRMTKQLIAVVIRTAYKTAIMHVDGIPNANREDSVIDYDATTPLATWMVNPVAEPSVSKVWQGAVLECSRTDRDFIKIIFRSTEILSRSRQNPLHCHKSTKNWLSVLQM